jgi:hypothetical protein
MMDQATTFHIGYFGDVRREQVGMRLLERAVETGSLVLRRLGGDRNGEASIGNFLGSPHVTPAEILKTCAKRTAVACRGRRIVAAQDTTEVNFSGRHGKRRGLGPAGDGKTPGFFAHAMVAVDADDEAVLGLVHAHIWTRPMQAAATHRARAIEDKESFRWIKATRAAGKLLVGAAQLIVVGDREFDIYSQFVRVPDGVDLIVRAAQNRRLADEDGCLFSAPSDWREFGTMDICVPPSRPGEAKRDARVSVKAGRVCLAKPRNGAAASDPASVTLTYVEIAEIDPPKGKDPIIWRLLTTLPVVGEPDEFAAACDIVRLYRLRWRIEQVFRSMKSDGFCLEETQVQDAARLFNLTAIALTAAVRTIQLVDARDGGSRPASDVADPPLVTAAHAIGPTLEGRTARQKNPHQLGSLPWLSWIVARLGGWNCYYKPPGPKTMRTGWNVLAAMAAGYAVAIAHQNV